MSYRSYVLQRENTDEYPYDDKYISQKMVDHIMQDMWMSICMISGGG